ncbi:IclR family transcriptional regulator C-terminal domain-containing protein [Streptomyces sp. NPDC058667]|uniref:IclR family transcriptional regulator domain-containing protein n=1 Tax=Streptomyces sp. NPDC058667 TaxID=3346588 RepID=UPI0036676E01
MTAVRRFNKDSSPREASAGLLALRSQLCGSPDFWDRPEGDFGPLAHLYPLTTGARQRANVLYRLGSKALARDELASAADWLGAAGEAGHPGALFRLALVMLRTGEEWRENAWFLVAEAARHGHSDARQLLASRSGALTPGTEAAGPVEDEAFLDEIREGLGARPVHSDGPGLADRSLVPDAPGGEEAGTAAEDADRLVLVPAPTLPSLCGPSPGGEGVAGTERPRLTALVGGLALPVPDLQAAPAAGQRLVVPGGEPWWSANALRPASLTRLARATASPALVPTGWQTIQRARDMLLLIHQADGIDTRTLRRRTRMPFPLVVRLLDWLRGQRFVDTVGGSHVPGPLMDLLTRPDPDQRRIKSALGDLRDELGAAVYLSAYTDGEIIIQESASSDTAPPVLERAPFGLTAHASAVGKSLLAQLNFAARMDHLSRYPSVQLTGRTITSPRKLFERLDGHGPHSAQFDLLEYSETELCVAFSLGLPGRASSIAISLPHTEHERLIDTAEALSRRATGFLLIHLLAGDPGLQSSTTRTGATMPPASPVRRALP